MTASTREYDDFVRELHNWYAENRTTIPEDQKEHIRTMLERLTRAELAEDGIHGRTASDTIAMTVTDIVDHYQKPKHLHSQVPAEILAAKETLLTAADEVYQAKSQGRAA